MPYKKPYKRKFRKKTRWQRYKNCGSMVAHDAKRALSVAYSVKNLLNVEFKRVYYTISGTTIPTTGTITEMSNLTQGDGNNTRDGATVKWMSWDIRYILNMSNSATQTSVRVMLVYDNQTNQAQYALADLLTDANAQHNLLSNKNMDNPRRFLILYDRLHTMTVGGANRVQKGSYIARYKKGFKLRYDANVGDITDLTQGSFSLVVISNETTNLPTITANMVGRFIDN